LGECKEYSRILAEELVDYYSLKQHKPWFEKEYSELMY
jgi:hypothetical protein